MAKRSNGKVESVEARAARAVRIFERLEQRYPDARCELDFASPFQLLIATILAAQCTDVMVNRVTPTLFKTFPDPRAFADAKPEVIEEWVRPCGAYHNKTKSVQGCCRALLERHGGEVPTSMDELVALPGVGRKTANVVLGSAMGVPGVAVDTHVLRLSQWLGLVLEHDPKPEEVERALMELLPAERWTRFCHLIQFLGRRCCSARAPECDRCVLNDGPCPSAFKVGKWAKEAAAATPAATRGEPADATKPAAKKAARRGAAKRVQGAKDAVKPKDTAASGAPRTRRASARKAAVRVRPTKKVR